MIAINLLPERKKLELKAKRTRRIVAGSSLIAIAVAIIVPVILFSLLSAQRFRVASAQKDIDSAIETLKASQDLSRILTVQNQLETLPGLNEERLYYGNLLAGIAYATPQNVFYSEISLDTTGLGFETKSTKDGAIQITGSAPTILDVNRFVQALSQVTVTIPATEVAPAVTMRLFDAVELKSVSPQAEGNATFEVAAGFDTVILGDDQTVAFELGGDITPASKPEEAEVNFESGEEDE